ncbi:MAG: hypothetical protein WA040_21395 [Anaerolineae bacterium]
MKRRRYPGLPVPEGKARQLLSSALMLSDDAQAAWIDRAVKSGQVVGRPEAIEDLKRRLDEVMEPNQPP